MQFHTYSLVSLYAIFYIGVFNGFTNAKPFMGHKIRSAEQHYFRFIAAITRRVNFTHSPDGLMCTASVISRKDVLTAAHCLVNEELDRFYIIAGDINLQSDSIYYPAWWITHDQWATITNITLVNRENDITMIRLTTQVADGIRSGYVSYIPQSELNNVDAVGVGWGEINNGSYPLVLQTADLKILTVLECEHRSSRLDRESGYGRRLRLPRNYLCSAGIPFAVLMCGDSGGPLMYRHQIVGINTGTCPLPAQRFHPDKLNLHINLFYYQQFIGECIHVN